MAIGKRLAAMLLTAAAATAYLGSPAFGEDWPQFRGPAQDGLSKETGLLKIWSAGGPPLAWKATGVGEGHSSVSVANGKVFTAGSDGDPGSGGSTYVIALKESDGTPIWKQKIGANWKKDQGGFGPRGTPTVDGDRVYMTAPGGEIACLNAEDGKPLWSANLKKDFNGNPPGWGYSESVVIDGDNAIFTPGGGGGTVLALNKMTGKQVWRSTAFKDPAAYAQPLIVEIGGVRQIISYTDPHVAGISSKDGSLLWMADRPDLPGKHGKTAVIPTPLVKDNYVYVTSGYGVGCDLYKVSVDGGKLSAAPVYSHDANPSIQNHHGGVILLDGNVYGYSDKGGWTCQDMLTGTVKWSDKGIGKGTIAYADGRFYLRSEGGKGTIALIEATPTAYKEISKFDPSDRSKSPAWPHLVIANGKLYVRDMDVLNCYDVKEK